MSTAAGLQGSGRVRHPARVGVAMRRRRCLRPRLVRLSGEACGEPDGELLRSCQSSSPRRLSLVGPEGALDVLEEQDEVEVVGGGAFELGDQVEIEAAGDLGLGVHE